MEAEEKEQPRGIESVDILKQLKPERETWLPEDKQRVVNATDRDWGRSR
jgi:hypothetical protein